MRARVFGVAVAAVALSWAAALPALAQKTDDGASRGANQTEQGPPPGQTGTGERGTKVAPSTSPAQPTQPTAAQTGVEPRGTKVGPSTSPGQGGRENR